MPMSPDGLTQLDRHPHLIFLLTGNSGEQIPSEQRIPNYVDFESS
jgi:hypothetical protein